MSSKQFFLSLGLLLSISILTSLIFSKKNEVVEKESTKKIIRKDKKMKMPSNESSRVKIIYVFDPLCGWCYGFEPVMKAFQQKYQKQYDFEFVTGGMVPKGAPPLSEMRDYLIQAIPHLEKKTGIKISQTYRDNILMKDSIYLDSELPTKVFLFLKSQNKGKEVALVQEIQDLLYQKGLNTNEIESYKSIEGFNLERFLNSELQNEMINNFKRSRSLQVRGFPAVFLEKEGQTYSISSGWTSLKDLESRVEKVLK